MKLLKKKLKTWNEAHDIIKKLQKNGKKIVFTNGCFDIIHAGHIQYLIEAKKLGDILIIGLNSDESVKKLKGNSRPINNEMDRVTVLSALLMIDYLVVFKENTPYDLIKHINPNVLVKGGDWKIEEIVGADIIQKNGGKVKQLSFKKGISTTAIIKRINGKSD